MHKKINIAILGCADIAIRRTLPALRSLPHQYNIIAVVSRDIQKAKRIAREYDCKALENYEQVFNIENLDAVYLPLPTGLHKKWIPKLLKNGLHVYAEKSIAMNKEDAKHYVDIANEHDLALMEGYMFQYHNQHKKIQNLISKQKIGKIRFFSSSFGFPFLDKKSFRYDHEIGGGILSDVAGYPLKATMMYLGNKLTVIGSSLSKSQQDNIEISGSALLKNEHNITSCISFGYQHFYQNKYELWGSDGYIKLEKAFTPGIDEKPKILLQTESSFEEVKGGKEDHFRSSFVEFFNIIEDKAKRKKHCSEIVTIRGLLDNIRNKSI